VLFLKTVDKKHIDLLIKKWGTGVPDYLLFMERLGIITKKNRVYIANFPISFIGNLLEWLIGKFLSEELHLETLINVRLKGFENGGDIDIISRIETKLVMIECKESPPNNVPFTELKHICERVNTFKPDIFIFAIDTTLSIKRNITDNLEKICKTNFIKLREGVYKNSATFFVVSSKRDLLQNISFAIIEGTNELR